MGILDLSANTNMFGTPPSALAALGHTPTTGVNRYPTLQADALRSDLARYLQVSSDRIVTGAGSDDVIDLALRALTRPRQRMAWSEPTFSMIPVFAETNHLDARPVPLQPDFSIDVDAFVASDPDVIYVCTPNNPTGTGVEWQSIDELLSRTRAVVIIDRAYAEFDEAELPPRLRDHDRVLLTGTMSKAFGLAGLRVGYGLASAEFARRITQVRGPYRLGGPAERAASAALRSDVMWMRRYAADARHERDRVTEDLRTLGLEPIASRANFVLVPLADSDAVQKRMLDAGIRVRSLPGLAVVGDALRITVGPRAMMERMLRALSTSIDTEVAR